MPFALRPAGEFTSVEQLSTLIISNPGAREQIYLGRRRGQTIYQAAATDSNTRIAL